MRRADSLRYAGALLTAVVGIVHLQQYADFISAVPTIGTLFVLNAAGAGALAIMLGTRLRVLGALGAIALSAGALASIFVAMSSGGLFDYQEPMFRTPVTIAIVAEIAAILVLAAYLVAQRRAAVANP